MLRVTRLGLVACLVVLAACGSVGSAPASDSPTSTATLPPPTLSAVEGSPARMDAAAIRIAFHAGEAAQLISPVPAGLDFGTDALLCVYLGERPTGGWALDLQSAALVDGELRILGRETRPRGTATQALTYPGDCASLPRAALPAGELAVRADDTISDEFIVDGQIEVPAS
jgi:hypothetical protein